MCSIRLFPIPVQSASKDPSSKELPLGLDASTEVLLLNPSCFESLLASPALTRHGLLSPTLEWALWLVISQANLLANKRRKSILSASIPVEISSINFHWAPFPIEMAGVSTIVPSPSGSKLLVITNPKNESPTRFEFWSQGQVEKEFHIPQSVHVSVYTDGWFEGISWNSDEAFIAYVAEEPSTSKPMFNSMGYKKGSASTDKDCSRWKGQGEWEEDWGETYAGKGNLHSLSSVLTVERYNPLKELQSP